MRLWWLETGFGVLGLGLALLGYYLGKTVPHLPPTHFVNRYGTFLAIAGYLLGMRLIHTLIRITVRVSEPGESHKEADTSSSDDSLFGIDKAPPPLKVGASLCCWSDLLGFGTKLYDANWKPTEQDFKDLYSRLTVAQHLAHRALDPFHDFMLVLNDGIVKCCDEEGFLNNGVLGLAAFSNWLEACAETHHYICNHEKKVGLPGIRTVLAYGPTLHHGHYVFTEEDFVMKRQPPDKTGPALGYRPVALNPTPLQLNLGFSKAYMLCDGGSKLGLKGPKFFIDQSVLDFVSQHSPVSPVWKEKNEFTFFGVPGRRRDDGIYSFGFDFAKGPIQIATPEIHTTVWEVRCFYNAEYQQEGRFAL